MGLCRQSVPGLTAPYMHNGILLSLEEVIAYYNRGGTGIEGQDERISPLQLTSTERQALLAFLHSLTGDNVDELAQETYPHAALPIRQGQQHPLTPAY